MEDAKDARDAFKEQADQLLADLEESKAQVADLKVAAKAAWTEDAKVQSGDD